MMVNEWTDRTGHNPTAAEWHTITTVYAFHPAIPDVGGKDKLAGIFALGGFGIIRDMLPVAEKARTLEQARDKSRADMEHWTAALKALAAEYGR
jgi:hypothetical protein